VSVKDRWIDPHEQVLNVPIACWYGFAPTASMVASGRETGYGPVDQSVVMLWFVSGAIFLGSSGSVHRC
jgi:hypothetical protein